MTEHTGVLIVGGGPTGLVAALLLAELGVRSIVVERNEFTDEHPKAHELNARSIEILRFAGVTEDELAAEASPQEDAARILFCRTINEELGRIDLVADPARKQKYADHLRQTLPYLNLSQSEFEKILVAHVYACPFADLRFSHEWQSFDTTDDGTRSNIKAGNRSYTVGSKFLLGCDGASSRVRRAASIEMEGPREIQSFVNAFFKADLRDRVHTPAKLYWIIHPEYAGTLVAHHMAKRWVYAVPVQKPWEQPDDFTPDVMRARIAGALGFAVPNLEIASTSTWHMSAQIAKSYRDHRVLLVGDAAHRFPPTGGLGMNTGIADAHNLCWKLAAVLNGAAGDPLLDTYETERRPVAAKNCEESRANFDKIFEVLAALGLGPKGLTLFAMLMNTPPVRWLPSRWRHAIGRAVSWPGYRLVGRGLRPGRAQGSVRSAVAAQINHFDRLGLDIGYIYEHGAVILDGQPAPRPHDDVSEYIPNTTPGARLPHVPVQGPDGKTSTHDYLSYKSFGLWLANPSPELRTAVAPHGVTVVDTSGFPAALFPANQALLVRPDGHVAWRGDRHEVNGESCARNLQTLLAVPSEPAYV